MNVNREKIIPDFTGYKWRSTLSKIINNLKEYEKISIIFLLCETPEKGVTIMEDILNKDEQSQNIIFYNWMKSQLDFKNENWENNLAELLAIIQNFRLGKVFGFSKEEMCMKFIPKNNLKTYNIPCIRKVLYNLCEELGSNDFTNFIRMMNLNNPKVKYLEYHLLNLSKKGVIYLGNDKIIDLEVLISCLKVFNLKNIILDLEVIVPRTNCQFIRNKFTPESELYEYYEIIDVNKLGKCVIINEKNFSNGFLPKRWGSDKDVERLSEVFTAFGFDITVHVDLSYEKLVKTLGFYAKTIPKSCSFFILIILSHGSENVIFTSDSIPVDMNSIEMIFQAEVCPNLIGKPKIFIVQSCQGEKWQRVVSDSKIEIETDNSISSKPNELIVLGPQRGDSMIAWSTVQGFASFRDKYNGSWYIQELCNELWKFGDAFDLVEIFTRVNNNLRSKVYDGQFMVPSLLLSLRAKIQFPSLKGNLYKGKQLMIERLLFEKFYKDFLSNCQCLGLELFLKVH